MKIKTKFMLTVSAILVTGSILIAVWIYHLSYENAADQAMHANDILASTIQNTIHKFMGVGRQEYLDYYLEDARKFESVKEIRIIRSASLEKEIGVSKNVHAQDDLENQALRSGKSLDQETIVGHERAVRHIAPVFIEKSCRNCHASFKEGEVVGIVSMTSVFQHSLDQVKKNLIRAGLIQGIIILLVIGAILILCNRLIMDPLAQLGDFAKKIGMGDWEPAADFDPKIKTGAFSSKGGVAHFDPHNEVGELAVTFNEMYRNLRETTVSRDDLLKEINLRKQADETKKRLAAILEATPDFVGIASAKDQHILYINKAGRKMIGVGEDEDITKLKIADVHSEQANRMLVEVILPAAARDGLWQGECNFLNIKDRHEISTLMVLFAHKTSDGEIDTFSMISHDITQRKRLEEDTRKNLQELEVFYKASMGREGRILELKEEVEQLRKELGK